MGYVLLIVFLIPTFFIIVPFPPLLRSSAPDYFFLGTLCSTPQFRSSRPPFPSVLWYVTRVLSLLFSSPSAHLQFFISRSSAFSFPDICASLNRYSLFYSSRFLLSSSLFRRSFIRFCSPIDHTFTIAPLVHSFCSLFHLLSSKICYREQVGIG